MKEFLDHFAAVLGAATIALLLFAVCHEYGYFWVIGSQFQTFVSTTDYFSNASQWIVAVLFALATWVNWFGIFDEDPPFGGGWVAWLLPAFFVVMLVTDFFFGRGTNSVLLFLF